MHSYLLLMGNLVLLLQTTTDSWHFVLSHYSNCCIRCCCFKPSFITIISMRQGEKKRESKKQPWSCQFGLQIFYFDWKAWVNFSQYLQLINSKLSLICNRKTNGRSSADNIALTSNIDTRIKTRTLNTANNTGYWWAISWTSSVQFISSQNNQHRKHHSLSLGHILSQFSPVYVLTKYSTPPTLQSIAGLYPEPVQSSSFPHKIIHTANTTVYRWAISWASSVQFMSSQNTPHR